MEITLNLEAGDDTVAVGSQAGLWYTGRLSAGERPQYEPAIQNSHFINAFGNVNFINGSVIVNGGSGEDTVTIDDTQDADGNVGVLTEIALTGLGSNGGVKYNNDGNVEIINIAAR